MGITTSTQNLACSQRQMHTLHTCRFSQAKTTRDIYTNKALDNPQEPYIVVPCKKYIQSWKCHRYLWNCTPLLTHQCEHTQHTITPAPSLQWPPCVGKKANLQRSPDRLTGVLLLDAASLVALLSGFRLLVLDFPLLVSAPFSSLGPLGVLMFMYYIVCCFTGIFYADVRQISVIHRQ